MTFVDGLQRFEASLVGRVRASFDVARRQYQKRETYNRTYAELNALTERELEDLGMARADIGQVAREAAERT